MNMNAKKRVNGSWVDAPYYIHKTAADTFTTLPVDVYADGNNATVGLKGNTVQSGTPTPDNPTMPQGTGDRTANLFDKNDCTVAGYIKNDGTISITADNWFTTKNYIKCSGTITLTVLNGLGQSAHIACYDEQKNLLGTCQMANANQNQSTINLIDGTKYIKACSRNNNLDSFMLNAGSTPLPYEPYGYKIPVVTRGKNLLKLKEVNSTIRGVAVSIKNNSITVKGTATASGGRTAYLSENFVLQPGTYFMSGDIVNEMVYCLTNKSNGAPVVLTSTGKFTLTEKTEVAFGLNFISGINYDATVNVMLNEGDKKLPYEPYHEPITTPIYLPTPLYSGEVIRSDGSREVKFGKLVLTGDEEITSHKTFADGTISIRIPSSNAKPNGIIYCTHLQNVSFPELYNHENQGISTHLKNELNNLYCLISGFTKLTQYKDFFRNEYSAGTPVTVWYQLATPTTETFTAPQIPTLNGTTVIDVDTEVKPSEVSFNYAGWHTAVVHKQINGAWD